MTSHLSKLTTANYRLLAAFRYEMRKFLAFSEQAAREAGIEPQQHQLLLALKGLPEGYRPTIGAVAERLCVQHHTAVALVDRLEQRHLLRRERASGDRREVLLHLTPESEAILHGLSERHHQQLASVGPGMVSALQALVGNGPNIPKQTVTELEAYAKKTSRAHSQVSSENTKGRPVTTRQKR